MRKHGQSSTVLEAGFPWVSWPGHPTEQQAEEDSLINPDYPGEAGLLMQHGGLRSEAGSTRATQ